MTTDPLRTFDEAIDYLYSYVNWEVERHVRYSPEVMTLERPRRVLSALGDPHRQYPVIHITGTKGKGSVGAMCAAALQAAGLRIGLYSSPHLQDFRERFRVNNQLIGEEDFIALVNDLRPAIETIPDVTWFEVTTALAFLFFARQQVDAAVIEVGLGGRLDATNVVTPVVSVITSLSYDHTYLLGDSLASIAREKGGIIKPGVPVVGAPQPAEALDVLVELAEEARAPFTLVGRDWLYAAGDSARDGQTFVAGPAGGPQGTYRTALTGEHQALNATVALAALEWVRRAGLNVPEDAIRDGFRRVDWPGRLEVVQRSPLLVLDAAHNGASARFLAASLMDLFPQRPIAFIFGASADKDVEGMFDALLPMADYLVAAQAVHPRALSVEEIAARARARGYERPIVKAPAAEAALSLASELVGPDGLICTTGSLFIVGEMRAVCGLPVGHIFPSIQQPAAPSRTAEQG